MMAFAFFGVEMDYKKIYQDIYKNHDWYGNASIDRCPGVRLIPDYKEWIIGPAIDIGCGRGHTVLELRKLGIDADGIDFINLNNGMMIGDICDDLDLSKYKTSICIDVVEHVEKNKELNLFNNLIKTERQVIAIHNSSHSVDGIELHINLKPWAEWIDFLEKKFNIKKQIVIKPFQYLFLTETKK